MKGIFFKKLVFFIVLICLGLSTTVYNQSTEKARFRLNQLEIRLPRSEIYTVPANINTFRKYKGFTLENIRKTYLENCEKLHIKPFVFDIGSDVFRELYKMHLIWLGVYPYPGYKEAKINFFQSVEEQLSNNPEVLKKFYSLFKHGKTYVTNIWDFVEYYLSARGEKIDITKLANLIAGLSSYNKRFINTKYFKKEEWSHPAYFFYQLDFYKRRLEEKYKKILKEIEKIDSSFIDQIGIVLSAYEEGAQWLKKASLFSLMRNGLMMKILTSIFP